jgi:hypothetical protein
MYTLFSFDRKRLRLVRKNALGELSSNTDQNSEAAVSDFKSYYYSTLRLAG